MRYYVSSERGNDENVGSIDAPFKSILKLADLMEAGDTGYLDGEFHEQIKLGGINGIPGGRNALQQTYIQGWPDANRPLIIGEQCLYAGDPDCKYITVKSIGIQPSGIGCVFDMPETSGEYTFVDLHIIPESRCHHNIAAFSGGKLYFTGLKATNAYSDNVVAYDKCAGIEIDSSEIDGSRAGSNFATRGTDEIGVAGSFKITRTTLDSAASGNVDITTRCLATIELCRLSEGGTHNVKVSKAGIVVHYNLMSNFYGGENIYISSDASAAIHSNILKEADYGVRLGRYINIEQQGTGKVYIIHNTIVYQSSACVFIDEDTSDQMFADQNGVERIRLVPREDYNSEDGDGVFVEGFENELYMDLRSVFIENNRFVLEGARSYISMEGIESHSEYVGVDGNRYFGSTLYDAWGGTSFEDWRNTGRDEHSGEGSDPVFSDPLNDNFSVSNIADKFAGIKPSTINGVEIRALVHPFSLKQTRPHDNTPGAFAFSEN